MAKNQPSHLTLTQKIEIWLESYFKYILLVVVLSISAFGGIKLWSYFNEKKNQQAIEELYIAKKKLIAAEKNAKGTILSQSTNSEQNIFTPGQKAPKYTAEMKAQVDHYLTLINRWKTQPGGVVSAIEMAYFLSTYNQNKIAGNLLKSVRKTFKKKTTLGFLLAFQTGVHLMNAENYTEALEHFEWIKLNTSAEWIMPNVLLKIALIYEHLKQTDKALKTYKQIIKNFSNTQVSKRAEQYMNILSVQNNLNNSKQENQSQ